MTGNAMTIERAALPGVGVGHAATTRGGQRLGVVSHLNGRREIVLYDLADPERAAHTVALEPAEARQFADLLNATVTVDHITDLERRVPGLTAARIRLPLRSPAGGRPLRDIHAGTAAIVAVIRGEQVLVTPEPTFVLHHDDVVVAVGDARGVTELTDLLATVADPPSSPRRHVGRPVAQAASRPAAARYGNAPATARTSGAGAPPSAAARRRTPKRGLTRLHRHLAALAMFVAALALTGLGLALGRGLGEVLVVAVLIVVALAGRLPDRHRRSGRSAAGPPGRGDERRAVDPAHPMPATRTPTAFARPTAATATPVSAGGTTPRRPAARPVSPGPRRRRPGRPTPGRDNPGSRRGPRPAVSRWPG